MQPVASRCRCRNALLVRVNDQQFLQRAAELAAEWMTFPNPRVGCVIVRDGVIVGEAAHQRDGDAHAEINALALAADRAHGATAYVTLEPCKHVGRTGSCADALIAAGIARVVIAVADPTERAGGGAERLHTAGVNVEFVACDAARAVNEHWLHAMQHGRPFVTLKLATSVDGRVARAAGVETRISNQASTRRVHELRARVDGILVGTGTATIDDPALTARGVTVERQPQRFVMGTRDLPTTLQLCSGDAPAVHLRTHDPRVALERVAEHHVRHLLIEGGPTVARAFVEAGVVDEIIWITAPVVFGEGPLAMGETPTTGIHRWNRQSTLDLDGDLWNFYRP